MRVLRSHNDVFDASVALATARNIHYQALTADERCALSAEIMAASVQHYTLQVETRELGKQPVIADTLHAQNIDEMCDHLVDAFENTLGEGTPTTREQIVRIMADLRTQGLELTGDRIKTPFATGPNMGRVVFTVQREANILLAMPVAPQPASV